jgi:hypothetical protein
MVKKFESFSHSTKEDIIEVLSDIYDIYDNKFEVFTKIEYLNSDEVKRGNIDGNMYTNLETIGDDGHVVKFRTFSYSSKDWWEEYGSRRYSVDDFIESTKKNLEMMKIVKGGFNSLNLNYIFYIKNSYLCYFFIE